MPFTPPQEDQTKAVQKCFAIEAKAVQIKENQISGSAAVIGNMDRGGDVLFPGAFRKVLAPFLKEGFVPTDHRWSVRDTCAMPISAKEQGTDLLCVSEFHSDPDSQVVRLKCAERKEKGLSVGLSIGFAIEYTDEGRMWFEDGASMLKYIGEQKLDESLFDSKSIRAWKYPCRGIFKVAELFEYSIVAVPMNPKAVASDIKSFSPGDGLPLRDRLESFHEEFKGLRGHIDGYVQMRSKDDREVSAEMLAEWSSIRNELAGAVDELDALLKSTEPREDPAAILAAQNAWAEAEAKRLGILN